jgi:hypothetical protein
MIDDAQDWEKALIVARNVTTDDRGGHRPTAPSGAVGRVPAKDFARLIDRPAWSANTVSRHYQAWQLAAAERLVPHAEDLTHGELVALPAKEDFSQYMGRVNLAQRGKAAGPHRQAIIDEAEAAGVSAHSALVVAENAGAMAAAIKGDPRMAAAAASALTDRARERLDRAYPKVPDRDREATGTPETLRLIAASVALRSAMSEMVAAVVRCRGQFDNRLASLITSTLQDVVSQVEWARTAAEGGDLSDEISEFLSQDDRL